ncbi:MAG: bifunctional proline dehydrogenase/L-glutamate gamma-semialdehyde dehydrogenase, partial [Chloroflexota bacterium]
DARWEGVPGVNVSVKLSSLSAHIEPAAPAFVAAEAGARFKALLRTARAHGAYVHVDMEQHRYRDLVHRVFEAVLLEPEFRDVADVGIVVQAYLRDAAGDIARLSELAERRGTPFTVRLVKGAYWDEERIVAAQNGWPVPVWEEKAATDASYRRCAGSLLAAWPRLRPAFGSHNPGTIADAVQQAAAAGLTPRDFEIQMLFGLAPELSESVADLGYRLRLYVPVGAIIPGMAYLVRRLLENTSNQAWFRSTGGAGPATSAPVRPAAQGRPPGFANSPPARFHEPAVRTAMARAIEDVRASFGGRYPLLLGDRRVETRRVD